MIDEKCWDDAHLMSVLTSRPQVECYEKLIQERKTVDLESQLHQWQEREAAVCPEDVGFEEYIKALQSQLQQEREKRQQAEADNAGIDAKYRNAIGVIEKAILDGNINYMGFQNQIDAFIQYAAKPHPGAALLEEVERLRKENANYKDIVGLSCEEYRIHRETIEQYKEALILACEELVRHAGGSPFADSTWRQHFLAKAKEAE